MNKKVHTRATLATKSQKWVQKSASNTARTLFLRIIMVATARSQLFLIPEQVRRNTGLRSLSNGTAAELERFGRELCRVSHLGSSFLLKDQKALDGWLLSVYDAYSDLLASYDRTNSPAYYDKCNFDSAVRWVLKALRDAEEEPDHVQ